MTSEAGQPGRRSGKHGHSVPPGRLDRVSTFLRSGLALAFGAGAATTALVGLLVLLVVPVVFRPTNDLEPGPLVVLSGVDPSGIRQKLISQWNVLHPNNRATLRELGDNTDAARTDMIKAAQAEDPVDLYNLDVIDVAGFADAGYVRPLDEDHSDVNGFLSEPLDTCRYNGKLWCLPFNTDAGLLYYRSDLVTTPPDSLPRITQVSKAVLGESTDSRLQAGFAGQLRSDYEGFTVNALEAIWAFGGEVVDDNDKVVIDSKETEDGLRWLADGLTKEPNVVLPRANEEETTNSFANGTVVFMRNWPVWYKSVAKDPSQPVVPVGVTALPASALGGQNLAIGAGSTRPRAAQALLNFLTSERSQQILFERGFFAATREVVYNDDVIRDRYRYAEALLDSIKRAHKRPVTAHYSTFSNIFRKIVNEALDNGGQLPDDATVRLEQALKGK